MTQLLDTTLAAMIPVDLRHMGEAQTHLDDLTKPQGSLGRLEELAARALCVQRTREACLSAPSKPLSVAPARMLTVAGDHGIASPETGVSLFPQEVTRQMVANFVSGGAAINVLTQTADMDLHVVDAGTLGGGYPEAPNLIQAKVRPGTRNMLDEPAMTREECVRALELGIDLAGQAVEDGMLVLGIGDMGIGNTTASTALYCAFLGLDPHAVAGPGTGLPPERVKRKAEVIAQVLARHSAAIDRSDGVDILAAVGGLEIAAMAGILLGAARHQHIALVDGFIATAAYTAAQHITEDIKGYCIFSHGSAEPGHATALQALGAAPLLDLGMRLGEGTGAALAYMLLKASAAVYTDMATFSQAGVSSGS
ncbi:MAG: nicotinate-nucleotide--dimethylbenzimidazole phosphoribosyltransferase [Desulfovibrio sp.]|nr:MAG: nicotinate-nucleotide--dimethylbenzimidazole phosphoribosyltransferase [Desulfovibrio sp.]